MLKTLTHVEESDIAGLDDELVADDVRDGALRLHLVHVGRPIVFERPLAPVLPLRRRARDAADAADSHAVLDHRESISRVEGQHMRAPEPTQRQRS